MTLQLHKLFVKLLILLMHLLIFVPQLLDLPFYLLSLRVRPLLGEAVSLRMQLVDCGSVVLVFYPQFCYFICKLSFLPAALELTLQVSSVESHHLFLHFLIFRMNTDILEISRLSVLPPTIITIFICLVSSLLLLILETIPIPLSLAWHVPF